MGLLSIASHLDDVPKPGLAFSDVILKHNFKNAALLEKTDNDYLISNSIGFDGDSIISACSTSDFWDGICHETGKLYKFSHNDNSVSPLLQLFSLNLKDNVKEISVCRNSQNKILLVCNSKITEEALKDFELADSSRHKCNTDTLNKFFKESSVLEMFQVNLCEAAESFILSAKVNSDFSDSLQKAIYNEFYNRFISCYNNKDASAYPEDGVINTVFIMDKAYSTELIFNHLVLNFREVLGSFADLAKINNLGKAHSYKEIADFLQAE